MSSSDHQALIESMRNDADKRPPKPPKEQAVAAKAPDSSVQPRAANGRRWLAFAIILAVAVASLHVYSRGFQRMPWVSPQDRIAKCGRLGGSGISNGMEWCQETEASHKLNDDGGQF